MIYLFLILGINIRLIMDNNLKLLEASKYGQLEVVVELLKNGADPNYQCNGGWTALTWASKRGHLEVVVELLENGADPNHRNNKDKTFLDYLKNDNDKAMVNELLECLSGIYIKG